MYDVLYSPSTPSGPLVAALPLGLAAPANDLCDELCQAATAAR